MPFVSIGTRLIACTLLAASAGIPTTHLAFEHCLRAATHELLWFQDSTLAIKARDIARQLTVPANQQYIKTLPKDENLTEQHKKLLAIGGSVIDLYRILYRFATPDSSYEEVLRQFEFIAEFEDQTDRVEVCRTKVGRDLILHPRRRHTHVYGVPYRPHLTKANFYTSLNKGLIRNEWDVPGWRPDFLEFEESRDAKKIPFNYMRYDYDSKWVRNRRDLFRDYVHVHKYLIFMEQDHTPPHRKADMNWSISNYLEASLEPQPETGLRDGDLCWDYRAPEPPPLPKKQEFDRKLWIDITEGIEPGGPRPAA